MNCLFIFNKSSGHHKIEKKINYILKSLKEKFSKVEIYSSLSEEDFINTVKIKAIEYDVLIFSGGDGTFNMVINALKDVEHKPIIGMIPSGTLNDASKNYGYSPKLKKSLKIIKKFKTKELSICSLGDRLFAFSASFGAYSNIPEITKNQSKALLGKFAYYFKAVPMMFEKTIVEGEITLNDAKTLHFRTNFLMALNSKYMGGFKINPSFEAKNDEFDILYADEGAFNGLLNYFFFKKHVKRLTCKKIEIKIDQNQSWDVDGEKGPNGSLIITKVPNFVSIISK